MCPLFTDVYGIDESDQEVDDEHPVVNAWWTVIAYASRTINDQCDVQQAICNIYVYWLYVSATIELYKQSELGYLGQRKVKTRCSLRQQTSPPMPPPGKLHDI